MVSQYGRGAEELGTRVGTAIEEYIWDDRVNGSHKGLIPDPVPHGSMGGG